MVVELSGVRSIFSFGDGAVDDLGTLASAQGRLFPVGSEFGVLLTAISNFERLQLSCVTVTVHPHY